jgi:hypothetical protein
VLKAKVSKTEKVLTFLGNSLLAVAALNGV